MIGLLGGSFDPIHIGHLRLALEIYQGVGLDKVILMPSGVPPHRPPPVASATQRLALVKAAITGEAGLAIDERELRRGGPSYTIDTLISLRAELGAQPLCLIVGMDAFAGLNTWRRWRELLDYAHIIVAQRPAQAARVLPREVDELLGERRVNAPSELRGCPAGAMLCWPVTQLDISSSQLRAWLAQGRSVRYLVSDAVHTLIRAQQLYLTGHTPVKEAMNEP